MVHPYALLCSPPLVFLSCSRAVRMPSLFFCPRCPSSAVVRRFGALSPMHHLFLVLRRSRAYGCQSDLRPTGITLGCGYEILVTDPQPIRPSLARRISLQREQASILGRTLDIPTTMSTPRSPRKSSPGGHLAFPHHHSGTWCLLLLKVDFRW